MYSLCGPDSGRPFFPSLWITGDVLPYSARVFSSRWPLPSLHGWPYLEIVDPAMGRPSPPPKGLCNLDITQPTVGGSAEPWEDL